MSNAVITLIKQAESLSPDETLELIMALLQRARLAVAPIKPQVGVPDTDWEDLRGLYRYPMFGEDAQRAVNRLREEWHEHEIGGDDKS